MNLLENFNPLQVADETISDFFFLKDYRDLISQFFDYQMDERGGENSVNSF